MSHLQKKFEDAIARAKALKDQVAASPRDAALAAEFAKAVGAAEQAKSDLDKFNSLPAGNAAAFGDSGSRADLADAIRAKGGFDTSQSRKIVLGSLGQKALAGTPADLEVGFIGLAGYGRDERFAYTAFPSQALGSALSVDTILQSARSLAAAGDMDLAIGGTAAKPASTVGLTRSNIDAVMIATVTEAISNQHWALPSVDEFVRSELAFAVGQGIDAYLVAQLTGAVGTNTLSQTVETLLEVYRKGVLLARADGFTPDVALLNPTDAYNLDVARDASDRYFGAGPGSTGFGSLWGLKVVESNAVTAGSPVLVDTRQFGQLLFGGLQWALNPFSDGTTDFFGTNTAQGRLETPMLVAVQRPEAIVEITLA